MEVKLTVEEAEEIFHSALCNGASYLSGYGFSLDYSNEKYREAKESLNGKIEEGSFRAKYGPCREDIWVEILRIGGTLTLIDGENEGHYNSTISLNDVHERVEKSPLKHLMDMINENDDAITADVILQTVFFNDVIFG
jgi:hypothetical protein